MFACGFGCEGLCRFFAERSHAATVATVFLSVVLGFAGVATGAEERSQAAIRDELIAAFGSGASVSVYADEQGAVTNSKVTVTGAVSVPVFLSGTLGPVTLDLNGHTVSGTNGVNGTSSTAGTNGGAAVIVTNAVATTELTVCDGTGSSGRLVGGNGGKGNPAGKGASAVVGPDGAALVVVDAQGLVQAGVDGDTEENPSLALLREAFPEPSTVEAAYEGGKLVGNRVVLGADLTGPIAISGDVGKVVLVLSGHRLAGADGVTNDRGLAAEDGASAIVIDAASGLTGLGETAIVLTEGDTGSLVGGRGGDGAVRGAEAVRS